MKLIIASLIIFSIIILFLFALFPSDISVSRLVQINTSKSRISEKIADLRRWKNWNELLVKVPEGESANGEQDRIDSNHLDIGAVSVQLIKANQDTVITRWQHRNKSFTGNFILSGMDGRVILEWTLHFHLNWYPWEKLASMFYDKQMGPLMEESLLNLRNELEAPAE